MRRRTTVVQLIALLGLVLAACGTQAQTTSAGLAGAAASSSPSSGPTLPTIASSVPGAAGQCTSTQTAQRLAPITVRPPGLGAAKAPLVIALHGAGGNGKLMESLTGLENVAGQAGFEVIFPSSCDLTHPWSKGQDLVYLSTLIQQQLATGTIDSNRVYLTGFSAGGAESWLMACFFSGQVAAIAIVSDAMGAHTQGACSLVKPIAQLLMVGTNDSTRWTGIPGRLPSAVQTTAWWRREDHCAAEPERTRSVSGVLEQTWTSCADGSAVALYEVLGAGHVWPPGGEGAPAGYSASEAVWQFLSSHRAAPTSLSSSDAALRSLSVARRGRQRVITAVLSAAEPVSVTLSFDRHGRHPLHRQIQLSAGSHIPVTLTLAPGVTSGRHAFTVRFLDSYRRTHTFSRTVRVPAPAGA